MSNIVLSSKPFLSYDDQIQQLTQKGLLINDKNFAIKLLKEHSYFALITGYKHLFKLQNGQYKLHTKIEDIFALYHFDDELRSLFLRYILKIEKHIKSLLSYVFCTQHGDGQVHYYNISNYAYTKDNLHEIVRFITELSKIDQGSRYPYIKHQKHTHGNIPLWVMLKALPFGTVSKMYSFLPQALQIEVSKEFLHVNESELQEMIAMLSRVRNICAHNERLFNYKDRQAIPNTDIHHILNIPKQQGHYKKGKKDLFATLIIFKYLLKDSDTQNLITELSMLLNSLCASVHNLNISQLQAEMGLPVNWEDLATCRKKR